MSLSSNYDFAFTLNTPLAKGDSIKFNFPEGYSIFKPVCFHRNSGTHLQVEVLHNSRSVICQGLQDPMAVSEIQDVSITGVYNPKYPGNFKDFYLETLDNIDANVSERIEVSNSIQIDTGKTLLYIKSVSQLPKVNTTHQFEFAFENDVLADGEIWITLAPEFRTLKPNCTLLKLIEAQPGSKFSLLFSFTFN